MQATWREAAGRGDPVILPLDGPPEPARRTPVQPQIPQRPDDLAGHYDVTISHPEPRPDAFRAFDDLLATAAAARGLSCAVLHEAVLDGALVRLADGLLSIGYHLDYFALWHESEDRYARLARAIEDAGGCSVNPTPRARLFTDKSAAHGELLRHGFGVPAALVLRPTTPDRVLTAAERALLSLEPGRRVFVKPANGGGGRGVVRLDPADDAAYLAGLKGTRDQDRRDSYQVQREVRPPRVQAADGRERPAYWRLIYCLGELFGFWWCPREAAPDGKSYRPLALEEIRRLNLAALFDYARDLAGLCGLSFFSTELCLGDGGETSRYTVPGPDGRPWPVVAVDYVNDQCDVDVQSRWPGGPPDEVVRRLAERFADEALRQRRRRTGPVIALRLAA